jgi:hypothetical protein
VKVAGAASPSTWQAIETNSGASSTEQAARAAQVRVKAVAQASVMTTLIRRNSGRSQSSRGVWRRAMPSVKGLPTASVPHAVRASHPKDSAPS